MQVEPGFVFHQGNSYYDPDTNCMVIICVRYDEFPDFSAQAGEQGRSYMVRQLWFVICCRTCVVGHVWLVLYKSHWCKSHTHTVVLAGLTGTKQAALERQDSSCTYLAHHELECTTTICYRCLCIKACMADEVLQ